MSRSHEVLEKALGSEPQSQDLSAGITALSLCGPGLTLSHHKPPCLQVTIRVQGKVLSGLQAMMQSCPVVFFWKTLSFPRHHLGMGGGGLQENAPGGLRP